jgi:hypothetical protein
LGCARDDHAIAGVLKLCLRELAEPLLTFELYPEWLKIGKSGSIASRFAAYLSRFPDSDKNSDDEKFTKAKALVGRLPGPHQGLAQYLCHFLHKVCARAAALLFANQCVRSPRSRRPTK